MFTSESTSRWFLGFAILGTTVWYKKNKTKRSSDTGRVKAGFWEKQRRPGGLAALLSRPLQTGGGAETQPQSQRTQRPHPYPAHQHRDSGSSTVLPTGGQRRWCPPRLWPHRCISLADVHLRISAKTHSETLHRPFTASKLSDHRGSRASALPRKYGLDSFVLCALFSFIFFDSFLLIALF